jgi:DNA polymerase-4
MVNPSLGQRKIIHVDMDCFYAAVEVKYRPSLKGKPIGIGGSPESRSVLCTASYEARKFHVRSAMPSSQAVRLCPQLILLPPNFELYKSESKKVQEIFFRFTDRVEPLSLDEAYLDVTNSSYLKGSATLIAREIKQMIRSELGLTASAGAAPNKFLAKIASDWKKPDGMFVIRPDQVSDFVKALEVGKIPGVGKVTEKMFHKNGIYTCLDLQRLSLTDLKDFFGSRATYFREISFGKDDREVESKGERKSLSVEATFSKDIHTQEGALKKLPILFQDWQRRSLSKGDLNKIRGHQIKVKYLDFKVTTHELSSRRMPTLEDFEQLFLNVWEKRSDPIRLLGLGVRLEGDAAFHKEPNQQQLSWNW